MQQAFKTMMGQMNSQSNQFNSAAFSPGSPFPFPTPPASPSAPQSRASTSTGVSQSSVTVDIPATKVEAAPATNVQAETQSKVQEQPKRIGNLWDSLGLTPLPFLDLLFCQIRHFFNFIIFY